MTERVQMESENHQILPLAFGPTGLCDEALLPTNTGKWGQGRNYENSEFVDMGYETHIYVEPV